MKETVIKEENQNAVRWHVLYGRYATVKLVAELEKAKQVLPIHDFFVPTEYVKGKERLVPGSYIFIKAEKEVISTLRTTSLLTTEIRFINATAQRQTVIHDSEVENFRKVLEILKQEATFTPVSPEVTEGDAVRIIRGPFTGIEGTLISKRGNRSCTVLVTLSDLLATPILSLTLDDLQYVELSSASRNRKRINEFLAISEDALLNRSTLSAEALVRLQQLVTQYSNTTLTGKLRIIHATAMCNALRALGHDDTNEYLKYREVKNEKG